MIKRITLALALLASPAAAWTFTSTPICTLHQPTEQGSVTVTYDPAIPEYAIILTLTSEIRPNPPQMRMEFLGGTPIGIGTDRHRPSDDGKTLTITDTGFGNVLNGLALNNVAQATSGDQAITMSLDGAAEAVAAFRNCPAVPTS